MKKTTLGQLLVGLTLFSLIFFTSGNASKLISNCNNLIQERAVSKISGSLLFDCGNGTSAFILRGNVNLTPTFNLPTSSSGTIGPFGISTNGCSGLIILTSGSSIHSQGSNSYVYCLRYSGFTSGGIIPSFSISWS